jgi:putative salt-induced outer membrane protein
MQRAIVIPMVVFLTVGAARAQPVTPTDGKWRGVFGAGLSYATGNTDASNLSVNADALRATEDDKWTLHAEALRARSDGLTSGNRARATGRYDWNLSPRLFSFGNLELERDTVAELGRRVAVAGGLGYKLVDTPEHSVNVFGGLGYTEDRYLAPRDIEGVLRESVSGPTALLGEESNHKLTDSTSARQRLSVTPDLERSGSYRAQWDAGLAVAMSRSINLTVSLSVRYDSDPGIGLKATDTLLTTGVSFKFD